MNQSLKDRQVKSNISRFICFRMFFNARFYYPVFALLFLEHGLTWEEFGILNGIWAISIILLEVPSGALADTIGRKRLIVLAALCMMIEMLALLFAPMNGGSSVFFLFALNRIISGVAEAAVSGADEALAYDSLKSAGREKEWGDVLEKAQKFTSLAFFFAMMTGSAFYDPSFVNHCLSFLGIEYEFSAKTLIKAPILLTLISSIVVLIAALGMKEGQSKQTKHTFGKTIRLSLRTTLEGGSWIWKTPLPFGILLASMVLDNVIRQFLTIASAYWSVIDLPLATFGLVASGMSLMGYFVPRIAKILADKRTPAQNFFLLCGLLMIGLWGISEAIPYWGILPAVLLYATMQCMNYLSSRYLNEKAPSDKRATVLSFRGLSTNVSYGAVSLLYSSLIAWIKLQGVNPEEDGRTLSDQDSVFVEALGWFPWYFVITLVSATLLFRLRFRKKNL
jgi:MFS family permease